ncbi:hypothetical protein F5J12DRAFT_782109 [Pisolithus orientalis]|uniref:uncharacterized protein n=1 Tax=Pisolithus orientalis TaxID=936130 RepID=UPI0022254F8C|nr:uncharacterized protein F5J12DRAFT_782109 [Pisolithus orientalis]KAI6009603.1 hypothetical protein F5J12DRAFT_782109 [Pisolithus orientalis]
MSTLKLILSRGDPLQTDFLSTENRVLYTSETITYARPLHGSRATTTVTRRDPVGGLLQAPGGRWNEIGGDDEDRVVHIMFIPHVLLFLSPEKFQAQDGRMYEWQISNYRAQLVPLNSGHNAAYVATFLQSSQSIFKSWNRKSSASLFVPPEGTHILDDIIVTFIYFESQWRDRERFRARTWDLPVAAT